MRQGGFKNGAPIFVRLSAFEYTERKPIENRRSDHPIERLTIYLNPLRACGPAENSLPGYAPGRLDKPNRNPVLAGAVS
jgi:hypothetical protein